MTHSSCDASAESTNKDKEVLRQVISFSALLSLRVEDTNSPHWEIGALSGSRKPRMSTTVWIREEDFALDYQLYVHTGGVG